MQIREMERKQKKREEEPVMKKWIVEKWKSVYGRRKILWKKYQIALWIEVIFIGVAAVCSGSLYQIERTNQTAAAQNVMEGIQNEIYHMVSGGGTPDEVRTLEIDEFDKCLEFGFHDEMAEVIGQLPALQKRVLLSATNKTLNKKK